MSIDYYKILGISRQASDDEIKKQYRKLARKYHPDVSKLKNAEKRFKEINEAYDVLKNPEKRRNYDMFGAANGTQWQQSGFNQEAQNRQQKWERNDFGGFGQGSFSDIFEKMFKNNQSQKQKPSYSTASHSAKNTLKQTLEIHVSLEDVYQGTEKTFILSIPGEPQKKRIKVKIPKGIQEGKKIRLHNQGQNNSDLFLKINYEPHRLFTVKENNILLNVPISIRESAMGATIAVPTLGGTVDLKIPPGSQSGKKLRLKGRGLGSPTAGDLYITLLIKLPPNNPELEKLYAKIESTSPFNPRENF